jgi:competence protein ComEC
LPSSLSDVLIFTVAAQILTVPLIAYTMGRLSVITLLTNLLILPVQPAVMWLGGASVLLGLIPFLEPLVLAIGLVPWLCLAYTNAVVRATADLPLASVQIGHVSVGWLVLYYSVVLGAVWLLRRRREYRMGVGKRIVRRESPRMATMALAVVAILALLALLQLPDGRLHVTFLDVGQGDAILITTPRGQQILVDGGPSPVALSSALGSSMPFWDRSLDLVVMTHPDADHITGLAEVLERYRVDGWLDNGITSALLQQHAIPRQAVSAGTRLDLGRGLVLDVLHPQSGRLNRPDSGTNNDSVVLRLEWGGLSFLLTGDIEAEAERQLIDTGQALQSDVLKVAHHGSAGSSSVEFLAALSPNFAVISVGADNLAGHPAPEVLERLLQQGGVTVLRTDQLGTVEFSTDGQRLWVRTER